MFSNVLIALKEDLPPDPLLRLAVSVTAPGSQIHLVTLLRVGNNEDEVHRLHKVESTLDEVAARLGNDGLEITHRAGLIAVAAAADILRTANDRESDLIVIGLAKRSRVGKALMGSDAQRILIGAPCPVLAVPLFHA